MNEPTKLPPPSNTPTPPRPAVATKLPAPVIVEAFIAPTLPTQRERQLRNAQRIEDPSLAGYDLEVEQ